MTHLNNYWDELLKEEIEKPYMNKLYKFLHTEYKKYKIYPPKKDIFTALKLTPYHAVRVVIIGQDPYHQPGQAMGMSFSVQKGQPLPPSLKNIYKEIENTTGQKQPQNGDLTRWAKQGVLLLNAVLTVRDSQQKSHSGKGWENFTDFIISLLNQRKDPIVFFLWGADAKRKKELITNPHHSVLTAAHPSPLSAYRGFFGCNHFNLANKIIIQNGSTPIEW